MAPWKKKSAGFERSGPAISFFQPVRPAKWDWTLMIMQPEWIDHEMFSDAAATVAAKKLEARIGEVRFGSFAEGRCVQTLHIGAFDDEAPVLAEMHDMFIPQNGLQLTGKHHEIYFSDPRKGDPAKRRTILRQPVVALV